MDVNPIISYISIHISVSLEYCLYDFTKFHNTLAIFGRRSSPKLPPLVFTLKTSSSSVRVSLEVVIFTKVLTSPLAGHQQSLILEHFLWMAPLKKIHQPQVVSAKLNLFLSFPTGFSWILINQHIFTEERSTSLLLCLKTFTSRARSDKGIDILTPGAPAIHAVTSCGPVKGLKSIVGEIHLFESEREFFKLWEVWERLWIYWCGFQFVSKHFKGGWIHSTLFISSKWWIQGGFSIEYWCIPPMRICF